MKNTAGDRPIDLATDDEVGNDIRDRFNRAEVAAALEQSIGQGDIARGEQLHLLCPR